MANFCGHCGGKLTPEMKFCAHCGTATKNTATGRAAAPVAANPPSMRSAPPRDNTQTVLLIVVCLVLLGGGGWYFSSRKSPAPLPQPPLAANSTQENGSASAKMPNPVPAQPKKPQADPMQYVSLKNQYDRDISKLAADINAYLGSHANFRGEPTMLSRAKSINTRLQGTLTELRGASIANAALKRKLLEVFDAEAGRVQGLIDGLSASMRGGDYTPGFRRGGDAFDRFEELNEELNKML